MEVTVNIQPLKQYRAALADNRGSGVIEDVFEQWGALVRAFLQERFVKQSRGGGEWPPLAETTKGGRRKASKSNQRKGKPRRFAILRDTSTLFNALAPVFNGAPGAANIKTASSVTIGFGGPAKHPKGAASIADIATFHQTGSGNLPVREIIVPPSSQVQARMTQLLNSCLEKLAKDTGNQ